MKTIEQVTKDCILTYIKIMDNKEQKMFAFAKVNGFSSGVIADTVEKGGPIIAGMIIAEMSKQ